MPTSSKRTNLVEEDVVKGPKNVYATTTFEASNSIKLASRAEMQNVGKSAEINSSKIVTQPNFEKMIE